PARLVSSVAQTAAAPQPWPEASSLSARCFAWVVLTTALTRPVALLLALLLVPVLVAREQWRLQALRFLIQQAAHPPQRAAQCRPMAMPAEWTGGSHRRQPPQQHFPPRQNRYHLRRRTELLRR